MSRLPRWLCFGKAIGFGMFGYDTTDRHRIPSILHICSSSPLRLTQWLTFPPPSHLWADRVIGSVSSRVISDNARSQEERVLTQNLALGFPIALCTTFEDGLAATRMTRSCLRGTSRGDLDDWETSLPSEFQGVPWQNDGISA